MQNVGQSRFPRIGLVFSDSSKGRTVSIYIMLT